MSVLAEHVRAKYSRRESASQIFNAVIQRKKHPDETFEDFAEALENLGLGSTLEEEQYVEAFKNGVSSLVRASLVARVPETLIEACERAHRMVGGDGATSERPSRPARAVEYTRGNGRVLTTTPGLANTGRRAVSRRTETTRRVDACKSKGRGSGTIGALSATRKGTTRESVRRERRTSASSSSRRETSRWCSHIGATSCEPRPPRSGAWRRENRDSSARSGAISRRRGRGCAGESRRAGC